MNLQELILAFENGCLVSFNNAIAYQNQLTCWIGHELFFIPVISTDKGVIGDMNDLYTLDESVFDTENAIGLAHEYVFSK